MYSRLKYVVNFHGYSQIINRYRKSLAYRLILACGQFDISPRSYFGMLLPEALVNGPARGNGDTWGVHATRGVQVYYRDTVFPVTILRVETRHCPPAWYKSNCKVGRELLCTHESFADARNAFSPERRTKIYFQDKNNDTAQ